MSARSGLILLLVLQCIACESVEKRIHGQWEVIEILTLDQDATDQFYLRTLTIINPKYNRYSEEQTIYVPILNVGSRNNPLTFGTWEIIDSNGANGLFQIKNTNEGVFDGVYEFTLDGYREGATLLLEGEKYTLKCSKQMFAITGPNDNGLQEIIDHTRF